MYDAQLIYSETAPATTPLFSPWFPRQGDNAWFTLEIVDTSAASDKAFILVFAYTKNSQGEGDGVQLPSPKILVQPSPPPAGAFAPFSPGLYSVGFGPDWSTGVGFLEWVRYGVAFGSLSGNREWVLMRMLEPSWFDTLVAS